MQAPGTEDPTRTGCHSLRTASTTPALACTYNLAQLKQCPSTKFMRNLMKGDK